jgi:hypothetical protein
MLRHHHPALIIGLVVVCCCCCCCCRVCGLLDVVGIFSLMSETPPPLSSSRVPTFLGSIENVFELDQFYQYYSDDDATTAANDDSPNKKPKSSDEG